MKRYSTQGKLGRAGVYIFMRGKTYLYIGSTRNLALRPHKRDKGHKQRWAAICEATHVKQIECESFEKAYQLEEQLIRKHHPIHNTNNPRSKADIERTTRIIHDNW
jgi:excinuclease UvrABC nuclease subunit